MTIRSERVTSPIPKFARQCALLFCLATAGQCATLLRIAAGGPGGADPLGNVWSQDAYSSGGASWVNCGIPPTSCPPGLTPPFFNLRYGTSFSYSIPVAPGLYTVTLGFIEPNKTGPGQRLFSVSTNGFSALSRLDVFQEAGGALKPITKTFPVIAVGGLISLQFTGNVGNAVISGIQVSDLAVVGATGPQGPPGQAGLQGVPGPQGTPGPLLPIQYDAFTILCSVAPPPCTAKVALTRFPVGRIGVFRNGKLMGDQNYTLDPPDQNGAIGITFANPLTNGEPPLADGDVLLMVYPATGPAGNIGQPH
jgi:Malectin domain